MLTVVTVLRSGGDYTPFHVCTLKDQVAKHAGSEPYRIVCLSDYRSDKIEVIPLLHLWPGWWSKLEIFRPGLFSGTCLYLDLDTIIVGPWQDLMVGHRFTVLRNFWVKPGHPRIGSGLMAWNADGDPLKGLYQRFRLNAATIPDIYVTKESWGDQGFIQENSPVSMDRWQDLYPGRVVSFKHHCRRGVPKGASIVCFHGRPRPWQTELWDGR